MSKSSPTINNTIKILPACFLALFLFYSISLSFANSVYAQQKSNTETKEQSSATRGMNIIVLGDSLTSGHGLDNVANAYPYVLERTLRKFGYPVNIVNMSVAGSSTSGSYARLLSYLKKKDKKYSMAIVVLGYTDAVNNTNIANVEKYTEKILEKLEEKKIATVLMGMKAPKDTPPEYASEFNAIYPKMSTQFNIPFYPFFLDGVYLRPKYTLGDNTHPSVRGVNLLVQKTSPIIMYAAFEALNGRKPVKHPKK